MKKKNTLSFLTEQLETRAGQRGKAKGDEKKQSWGSSEAHTTP